MEGSPYEELLQHENALIALYSIPPETRHGHVNGFFPKILDTREQDSSGWIFARADRVFFAVRPFTPGRWTEQPDHFRLTLDSRRTGLIFEAASVRDYASFAEFQGRIRKNQLDVDLENLRVRYTTARGVRLEFSYPARRLIDGEPVDFSSWPLYSGPFINAGPGARVFVLTQGGEKLVLDFNDFSVR